MLRSTVAKTLLISTVMLCAAGPALAGTRPQYGGTLHVETAGDPELAARTLVFDTLTRIDESGAVQPSLATRWTQENQSQRWQFWLRSGVSFHDGSTLTADDVVRSLTQACGNSCPWKTLRAVGESVVMTSDSPAPTMPAELARTLYIVTKKNDAGEEDGTGAFRISSRTRDEVSLAAVNDAWQGRPFLDSIQVDGRRSVRSQWLDLSVGHADIVDVPAEQIRAATQAHLFVVSSRPTDLIALIVHSSTLRSPEQRTAVADIVDRAALWNVIFQKQGEQSASLLPNALSGYSFLFATQPNLAQATQLVAGQHLSVSISTDSAGPTMQLVAERLALNLREAGWNAQNKPSTAGADLVLQRVHLDSGDARAALHRMLRELGKDADDNGGDAAALYRVERGFLNDHTIIPLLWLPRAYAVNPRVRGLRLAPDGTLLLGDVSLKADQ